MYYKNGIWQDQAEDYDLAIFVYRKSEANIVKNKVSDFTIDDIKSDNIVKVGVFDNYWYISLNRFELDISSMTLNRSNIAIVIFEKELYVFVDDKLIDWINRVVDIFKKEKRVSRSVFVYNVIFALMSELNLMLKYLDNKVYYISKKIYETTKFEDQKTYIKNLIEIKDLILELRLYFTDIKEVLTEIRPLFRKTVQYYNELSDRKENYSDNLYRIEQDIQNAISTTFLLADLRQTEATKLLTAISAIFLPMSILVGIYGMNFDNIPELENPLGYYLVLILLLIMGVGSYYIMKKKEYI
jgi:magnesium transporter